MMQLLSGAAAYRPAVILEGKICAREALTSPALLSQGESTGSVWPRTARCLPFETSPPGPLSTKWRGGKKKARLFTGVPPLQLRWRGGQGVRFRRAGTFDVHRQTEPLPRGEEGEKQENALVRFAFPSLPLRSPTRALRASVPRRAPAPRLRRGGPGPARRATGRSRARRRRSSPESAAD